MDARASSSLYDLQVKERSRARLEVGERERESCMGLHPRLESS